MNTLEKRKLEALLTSKLDKAREAYQQRRLRERQELVEDLEQNPPKEVGQLTAKLLEITAKFKKQSAEIEEKAEALGYSISVDRDGEERVCLQSNHNYRTGEDTYSSPQLQSHIEKTRNAEQRFDDLTTDYTVAIWAESGDMASLLEKFTHDVESIT